MQLLGGNVINRILSFYRDAEYFREVQKIAVPMIIVVGILRAGGDTRFSLFLDGIIIWLVGVPMAYLAAFVLHLPVYLVYLFAMSEEATKWLLGISRYRSHKWINNLAAQVEGV